MGRRKRAAKKVIFCYYCDRTFNDEASLIEHQKSKHFRCELQADAGSFNFRNTDTWLRGPSQAQTATRS